ncbi:hypothetical protein PQD71_gp034 [Kosakonia phage Kc263]|uniref:Uncharacterized protein n=1 Tax=Kosakonia phage Kc263 TaxID=2863194 RepID=A0AAE8BGH1_9CAUD|nr:hypothetical protein PQD71_gp034 [Kosakonia phage Kc263]QYN79927.1 hypothetical protein [Kosakonia phage Kc263]
MSETTDVTFLNELVSDELKRLMHRFGNLLVHVSGEGKVDFRGATGDNCGWIGMSKTIISGDLGCMTPYSGFDTCALDVALDFLYNLDLAPHLNSSINEEFVPAPEEWRKFIDGIKVELKNLLEPNFKMRYTFTLYNDEEQKVPVATVRLEPLCNAFVIGEFNAAGKHEYLGVIEDYDQPKINHCWITVNGSTIDDIELKRIIHFRHRRYQPRKGDYLLYDAEKDVYIILPQEDYNIH